MTIKQVKHSISEMELLVATWTIKTVGLCRGFHLPPLRQVDKLYIGHCNSKTKALTVPDRTDTDALEIPKKHLIFIDTVLEELRLVAPGFPKQHYQVRTFGIQEPNLLQAQTNIFHRPLSLVVDILASRYWLITEETIEQLFFPRGGYRG